MAAFTIAVFICFTSLLFLVIGVIQIIRGIHRKKKNQSYISLIIIGIICLFPSTCTSTIAISNGLKLHNQSETEKGPLISAIQKNNYKKVLHYLDTDFDINEVRRFVIGSYYEHHTPLSFACLMNNYEIAELLIAKGADVNKNIMWDSEDKFESLTPIMIACKNNNEKMCNLLIKHGADINKKTNRDSVFLIALKFGDLKLVKCLIDKKVDINLQDIDYTDTPIYTITEYNPKIDILNYIIESSIDNNVNYTPQDGVSVFMLSIKKNNSNLYTNTLISYGASIDGKDIYQNTALDFAYKNSNKEMIDYLISKGIRRGNKE
jgi:ankyrin repeat protein